MSPAPVSASSQSADLPTDCAIEPYYDESSVTVASTPYTVAHGKGRMTHTSAAGGTAITIHSYDGAGRLTDFWQCTPFNCSTGSLWDMQYVYSSGWVLNNYNHPAGFNVSYGYSNAAQITALYYTPTGKSTETLGQFTYAPTGAVASISNGGATTVTETWDYNNRLQAVRIQLGNSGHVNNLACWVYNYYSSVANPTSCSIPTQGTGNDGTVVSQYYNDGANSSLSHTASYTYDPTHRLTSSIATGSSTHNLTFSYDRYGNMNCQLNQQTNGLCPQYSFSIATNRITNSNFTYDSAGDLTQDGTGVGTHTYSYDAEGRLISVDNGSTASYVYNALGERAERNVGGTYTE